MRAATPPKADSGRWRVAGRGPLIPIRRDLLEAKGDVRFGPLVVRGSVVRDPRIEATRPEKACVLDPIDPRPERHA